MANTAFIQSFWQKSTMNFVTKATPIGNIRMMESVAYRLQKKQPVIQALFKPLLIG